MSWKGLSEDQLRDLELHLTRHRVRTDLLGGRDPDIVAYGHAGVAGRLIDSVYNYLERLNLNLPTKKALSGLVRTRKNEGVKQNVLSKFLSGHATSGTKWFKYSRDLLWHLMLGVKGEPDEPASDATNDEVARYKVAKRIHDFYYRDCDDEAPDEPTPFFRYDRLHSRVPYTRGELGLEVMWYGRYARRTGRAVEMVWVSGGQPFFVNPAKRVGSATAATVCRGVRTTFVFHSLAPGDRAKENLGNFYLAHPEVKEKEAGIREIDLALPHYRTLSGWWNFCSPALSFLYLSAQTANTKSDETLYILRGGATNGPICVEANAFETQEFLRWWRQVRAIQAPIEPAVVEQEQDPVSPKG